MKEVHETFFLVCKDRNTADRVYEVLTGQVVPKETSLSQVLNRAREAGAELPEEIGFRKDPRQAVTDLTGTVFRLPARGRFTVDTVKPVKMGRLITALTWASRHRNYDLAGAILGMAVFLLTYRKSEILALTTSWVCGEGYGLVPQTEEEDGEEVDLDD